MMTDRYIKMTQNTNSIIITVPVSSNNLYKHLHFCNNIVCEIGIDGRIMNVSKEEKNE